MLVEALCQVLILFGHLIALTFNHMTDVWTTILKKEI
jgi:hypothetical protein